MSTPARGTSFTIMRVATCKDCRREIIGLERDLAAAESDGRDRDARSVRDQLARRQQSAGAFSYSEHSANGQLDRGGSRSDRCPEHRKKHRTNTQGMAVAYVDLQTIGEALGAHSSDGPTGPFGGLGPLPPKHEKQQRTAKLAEYEFGMTDLHIVEILELLREHRVLVLRAGTGTGKSTFSPYRLMDPPTMTELADMGLLGQLADKGCGPPSGRTLPAYGSRSDRRDRATRRSRHRCLAVRRREAGHGMHSQAVHQPGARLRPAVQPEGPHRRSRRSRRPVVRAVRREGPQWAPAVHPRPRRQAPRPRCRGPSSRSWSVNAGPGAWSSSRSTNRGNPAAVAVSYSSSV